MPRKPNTELSKKTTIRVPIAILAALKLAAIENARSENEEMVARLRASENERLAAIERELAEMKVMLRKLLDAAG